jgi:hypothetical protein
MHPCGNLPVTTLSGMLWYCTYHQAWWWSSSVWEQRGEDEIETLAHRCGERGPFDRFEDAAQAVVRSWMELAAAPEAPWASAHRR